MIKLNELQNKLLPCLKPLVDVNGSDRILSTCIEDIVALSITLQRRKSFEGFFMRRHTFSYLLSECQTHLRSYYLFDIVGSITMETER